MEKSKQLEEFKMFLLHGIGEKSFFGFPAEVDVSKHISCLANEIWVRVVQSVFGETVKESIIRCPADWKEAIKERWFSGWAKKIWPVRYMIKKMTWRVVYPFVSFPDELHNFIVDTECYLEDENGE